MTYCLVTCTHIPTHTHTRGTSPFMERGSVCVIVGYHFQMYSPMCNKTFLRNHQATNLQQNSYKNWGAHAHSDTYIYVIYTILIAL